MKRGAPILCVILLAVWGVSAIWHMVEIALPLWTWPLTAGIPMACAGSWRVRWRLVAIFLFACVVYPTFVKAQVMSHYVTAAGNASSNCTLLDPCTLTRAAALVGGATIPAGSNISVDGDGDVYSQAGITISGSGTSSDYVSFYAEDGVRVVGTRLKIDEADWSLSTDCTGGTCQYTYEAAHSQATFNSSQPAQRPENTTWQDIQTQNGETSNLRFDLIYSPKYPNRTSVDEVEAQHCTHYDDATTVYVHMCHDGPPDNDDELYLSSTGWGQITITGDYIRWDNFQHEHVGTTNGGAIFVSGASEGVIISNYTGIAAPVFMQGDNGVIEDFDISHVILHGDNPSSPSCYDANPGFGVGECWNVSGDGAALELGVDSSTSGAGNIARRGYIHRGWNGGGLHGPNTWDSLEFWGFQNHISSGSSTGGTIQNSRFINGQDSIYWERKDFDDLTIVNNLLAHGALFWVSSNQNGAGTPPTSYTIQRNILPTLTLEDMTYDGLVAGGADCNLWIESPGGTSDIRMRSIDNASYSGGTNTTFDATDATATTALSEIQAATPFEDNGAALEAAKWTDGTQFVLFTNQYSTYDLRPASASVTSQTMAGCGVVGPYTHAAGLARGRFSRIRR